MTSARPGGQDKLFDSGISMPNGLVYRPDFISPEEEFRLLAAIDVLPLERARHQQFEGNRLWAAFDDPLPSFLEPSARKVAKWLAIPRARVAAALINEYPPGAAIGWHRDNEGCEHIVGISLGGWATMRWRPFYKIERGYDAQITLELEPRSAYIMQKSIRFDYQHSVAPVRAHRTSITFRTNPY